MKYRWHLSSCVCIKYSALGLLLCSLAACEQRRDRPQEPSVASAPEAPAVTAELAARGQEVYAESCAMCHGAEGRGDGPAAYLLQPRPRDFVSDGFRFVSTTNGPTDVDLFRTITRGMPGSAMPPWGHLSETDRWAAVAEVRRLEREGLLAEAIARGTEREEAEEYVARRTKPGEPIVIPPATIATPESIERGRMLYLQACASCHDADGRGRERRDLKDSNGFPIFARDLTRGVFKSSADPKQIALRMLAGIPKTPMPSYADLAKTPDDLWAIVHFVRSLVPPAAEEQVLQKKRTLHAVRVSGPLTADLKAPVWAQAKPTYVALMPLIWNSDRTGGMLVRVVHDGKRVAVRMTWTDATEDRLALRSEQFCDGVAIQLSGDATPPLFTMGSAEQPITIWNWKALWHTDADGHQDVEHVYPRMISDVHVGAKNLVPGKDVPLSERTAATTDPVFLTALAAGNAIARQERGTPVEALLARGFGTLTARPPAEQIVDGAAEWNRGIWDVVFVRDLTPSADALALPTDKPLSIGFAVWDGSLGDRDGRKAVTIWHELRLDR